MQTTIHTVGFKRKIAILTGFIIIKFLLQFFLINPTYDLQRDEYLYLDQANHLAWGYASVPPLSSWISRIILFLGNTIGWIRFFPALFGALTIVVVWKAVEVLKGSLFALVLASTCTLCSCLLRLNTLYQPNSFDVLCWTTFYFTLVKYIKTEKPMWLFVGAVVFAIGFLNKYNIIFLVLGLLPGILLNRQRNIFAKKEFYFAVLLALLLVSPNLLWQYKYNFPVYYHMKELASTQLALVNRWDFLKEQVLYFVGSFAVLSASLYALLLYPPFKRYRLFWWGFLFTLGIFVYLKAKGYYAIGIYPIYISFGSVYLGNTLVAASKRYFRPFLLAIPVISFLLLFNVFTSYKNPAYIEKNKMAYERLGLLRWEDGYNHALPQDNADMLGWKQLALLVDSIYAGFSDSEHTLILCDNYGQAGAINYYAKRVKASAVSFNADYNNWFDLKTPYKNLIRVKSKENKAGELETSAPFFANATVGGTINNAFAREYGTTIFVFKKAKIDIRKRLADEMIKTKENR